MPLLGTRGAASARGFGLFSSLTTLTTDPYFKYVTMLLHGDGTNGAQNNTFLDSSTNNFTITRNGNTTQGSFSPYGSNWSNYFDAYTKYLTVNAQTALSFGTGDFTIEAWVYVTSISSYAGILETRPGVTGQTYVFGIYNSSGNRLDFYMGPSVTRLTSASTVNLNSWNHVAVSRSGTTVRLFINGVLDANTVTTSASIDANATTQLIGTIRDGDGYNLNGYISNLRVVKGTAVYTSSFIPSTAPLTAISGTSLLTCQSNRFIDNSTNAFAITVNGTPSVQRFSPFSPTAAYSAATVGGSGYFDGSGDYLTVPSNAAWAFGTGDFTIECWVNPSTQGGHGNSNNDCIIDFRPGVNGGAYGTLYIRSSGTGVTWYANGANQINGGAIPNNTWTHVVVSRVSGNTRLFLNGIQSGGTYADSTNYAQGTPWIALFNDTIGSGFFNGYITDMRVVKGSGVTSVTVPTAPLTAITNTQLLLSYTNGG
ncbi:MAG: LamG domain-containing protein, partial [Micrococcales bacterium]|nr:LamG domain-containing protein [Micrococcales bacterium]